MLDFCEDINEDAEKGKKVITAHCGIESIDEEEEE
jgi:hypothetical protein